MDTAVGVSVVVTPKSQELSKFDCSRLFLDTSKSRFEERCEMMNQEGQKGTLFLNRGSQTLNVIFFPLSFC